MRTLTLELLKVGMGLVLIFGILEMVKFFLFISALGYIAALFLSPLVFIAIVVGTVLVVIYSYATVFIIWKALKSPASLQVGVASSLSQVALINAIFSAMLFDVFLALANLVITVSFYLYGKEKAKEFT